MTWMRYIDDIRMKYIDDIWMRYIDDDMDEIHR